MQGHGWLDIRGDQLRDAVTLAGELDPHDAGLLRLEYLSDGALILRVMGKNGLRVVSEPSDD